MFIRRRVPEQGPLQAAVIGAGMFGRHHAAKYRELDGVKLFAVADPSAEARRNAAAHGTFAVSDWRDLLGSVDLVSICSPATTHASIVRSFLNAGAHVLVEKPIATSLEEADELIRLAAGTGRVLTVGHQERFVFARTGLLGRDLPPREIQCWRQGPWSGRGADVSVVLDLMIHDLDLVHMLVGRGVERVAARGVARHCGLADEVSAELVFENGTVARLETSRMSDVRRRGMRAVYADGVVEIDFLARKMRNTTRSPLGALEMGDPLGESVAAFVRAATDGTPALVRPEEARQALETALLIDEAAEAAIPAPVAAAYARTAAAR